MESMGSKKGSRPRRWFTAGFKAEIVELCQRGDRSIGQVAGDFDLTETAVRESVKQPGGTPAPASRGLDQSGAGRAGAAASGQPQAA